MRFVHCPNCGDESFRKIFDNSNCFDIGWEETMLEVQIRELKPKCKKCGALLTVVEKEEAEQ